MVLKDDKVKKLYMTVCEFDSDYEALEYFLKFDGTLHKSKYIKKYLNSAYKRKGR